MCLVGLEEGLTMEELPSLNPDQTPADFGNLVRVRLKEKQDNERARTPNGEMIGSPLRMQNGEFSHCLAIEGWAFSCDISIDP